MSITRMLWWFLLGGTCFVFLGIQGIFSAFAVGTANQNNCLEHYSHIPKPQSSQETRIKETSTTPSFPIYNTRVRLVFFVGLEGTGHHLMKAIVSQSPALDRLRQLKIHYPLTSLMQESFHHEGKKIGLFNVHCQEKGGDVNITQMEQKAVDTLIAMRDITEENKSPNDGKRKPRRADDEGYQKPEELEHVAVPVNTLQSSPHSGEMSYPNFHGACRKLNYPNLDLFYQVCHKARVDCQHVYIYRDPYAILKSTTVKRDFNQNNRAAAMHLYISMLHIIQSQLATYASHTAGCYGMLEDQAGNDWWGNVRDLFGWKNQTSFDLHTKAQFYKPHHSMTNEQRQELVPPPLQVYMDSWLRAHRRTIQLCQEMVQRNTKA